MDIGELYRRTLETWTTRVTQVPDDRWDAPTPCTEWTVRDLVNHVAGEDAWTVPLVRGSTIAEVGDSLDGDLLGEDPVGAATELAHAAGEAVEEALPAGRTVQLSYGEESLEEYLRQLAADHLIHGWDLAAATGSARDMDPAAVDEVAAWFADREEMYRSGGAVGPRVSTDRSGAQAELLAAGGRDPAWEPPSAG
jgi:uncharacterized protein (TIGR03086 family)